MLDESAKLDVVGIDGSRTLAQQRQDVIAHFVRLRGAVRVAELAELCDVSDMTIRRDLDALHESGVIIKVHGGATVPTNRVGPEPGFTAKSALNMGEKAAIAAAAAAHVAPGSIVGLSAGTTTWQLALALVHTGLPNLTVVTNSVRVSEVLSAHARTDWQLVLTGGIRTQSDALVGPIADHALGTMSVETLFIGAHGMSERGGFMSPNLLEGETNREFIRSANRTVVLADHTKWGETGLGSFAPLDGVDAVISDIGLSENAQRTLRHSVRDVDLVVPADVDADHDVNQTTDPYSVRSA